VKKARPVSAFLRRRHRRVWRPSAPSGKELGAARISSNLIVISDASATGSSPHAKGRAQTHHHSRG
jgi:hypothetical protein